MHASHPNNFTNENGLSLKHLNRHLPLGTNMYIFAAKQLFCSVTKKSSWFFLNVPLSVYF